jgi:hypothetical protein
MKKYILVALMIMTVVLGANAPVSAAYYQGTPGPSLDPVFGTLVNFDDKVAGNPVLSNDYLSVGVASIVETESLGTLAYYSGSNQSMPNYIGTGFEAMRSADSCGWDGTIEITLVQPTCKIGIGIAGMLSSSKIVRIYDASGVMLEEQAVPNGCNVYVYFERSDYDIKKMVVTGDFFALDDLQFIPSPPPNYTAVSLTIDIKPWDEQNSVNTKSKGVIPVAILGSSMTDVTTFIAGEIDLYFGPNDARPAHDINNPYILSEHIVYPYLYDPDPMVTGDEYMRTANDDLIPDLIVHFSQMDTGLNTDSSEAALHGTINGLQVSGSDTVRIVQ